MADTNQRIQELKKTLESLIPQLRGNKLAVAELRAALNSLENNKFDLASKSVLASIQSLERAFPRLSATAKASANEVIASMQQVGNAIRNVQAEKMQAQAIADAAVKGDPTAKQLPTRLSTVQIRTAAFNPAYISPESLRIRQEGLIEARQVEVELNKIINTQEGVNSAAKRHNEIVKESINYHKQLIAQIEKEADALTQASLREYIPQRKAQIEERQKFLAQQRLITAGKESAFTSVLGGVNTAEMEKFDRLLSKYGVTAQHITGITKDLSTGMKAISFSMQDANGVVQQGTLHIDRYGRIAQEMSGKFRNIGDIIATNIVKVLQWAVAIGVVYGSMQKLTELFATMQKLQDQMVNIGITTRQTGESLGLMFDAVKSVSDATGTDLREGLEGLNTALRVTSGIEDQTQRTAASVKLLNDALTLAKLGGIGQAEAMDNLVASLKQMGLGLDQGSVLLDKFQAISQRANTSMEAISNTFAITSGAAADVGVDINELAGLIGAFSEATTLSATETGNALRAMFSNFTQPQAVETLNKYGIAVKDVSGEFKSFTDIFKETSELARSGILSDRQIAELANALGGGSRRQAQVRALLEVQPKAEELANVARTTKAGEAQDALSRKTETLSTAIIKLENAFTSLAESFGTSGGFISVLTTTVNLLTGVVSLIDKLVTALGPASTAIIGTGIAMASWRKFGPNVQEFFGNVRAGGAGGLIRQNVPTATPMIGPLLPGETRPMIKPNREEWISAGKSFAGAAVPVLITAISQLQAGDTAGGIGTAIGGGLVAFLTGNPVWAIIGGILASAIVSGISSILSAEQREETALKLKVELPSGAETREQLDKSLQQYRQEFLNLSNVISNPFIRAGANLGGQSLSSRLAEEIDKVNQGLITQEQATTKLGITDEQFNKAKEFLSVIENIQKVASDRGESGSLLNPKYEGIKNFFEMELSQGKKLVDLDKELNREKQFELIQQLGKGEISKGEYKEAVTAAIPTSGGMARDIILAQQPQLLNASKEALTGYVSQWKELKELLSTAPAEDRTYISEKISNINQLNDSLENIRGAIEANKALSVTGILGGAETEAQLNAQLKEHIALLQQNTDELNALLEAQKKVNAEKFKFLGFQNVAISSSEVERTRQQALELQNAYASQLKIPQDTLNEFAQNNPFIILTKDGTFQKVEGVIDQFWQTVIQQSEEAAKAMQDAFTFKNLRDLPASMGSRLQQAINYYTSLLKKYGFNEKNDLITVLFKDNQVGQLVGSQTALQLALEDLTAVEKKQLDGLYNLPSGATAFIPLQAGQLLSNYTENMRQQSNVNYGNFPTPEIGSAGETGTPTVQQIINAAKSGAYTGAVEGVSRTVIKAPKIELPKEAPETRERTREILREKPLGIESIKPIVDTVTAPMKFLQGLITPPEKKQGSVLDAFSKLMEKSPLIQPLLRPSGKTSEEPIKTVTNLALTIQPQKVTHQFNASVNLLVSGQVLANAVFPFIYERLTQLYKTNTTATGSSTRGSTSIISV